MSSAADGSAVRTSGSLVFCLRVENPKKMEAEPEVYTVPVPTYVPPKTSAGRLPFSAPGKAKKNSTGSSIQCRASVPLIS